MIATILLTLGIALLAYGFWQNNLTIVHLYSRLFDLELKVAKLSASLRKRGDR